MDLDILHRTQLLSTNLVYHHILQPIHHILTNLMGCHRIHTANSAHRFFHTITDIIIQSLFRRSDVDSILVIVVLTRIHQSIRSRITRRQSSANGDDEATISSRLFYLFSMMFAIIFDA